MPTDEYYQNPYARYADRSWSELSRAEKKAARKGGYKKKLKEAERQGLEFGEYGWGTEEDRLREAAMEDRFGEFSKNLMVDTGTGQREGSIAMLEQAERMGMPAGTAGRIASMHSGLQEQTNRLLTEGETNLEDALLARSEARGDALTLGVEERKQKTGKLVGGGIGTAAGIGLSLIPGLQPFAPALIAGGAKLGAGIGSGVAGGDVSDLGLEADESSADLDEMLAGLMDWFDTQNAKKSVAGVTPGITSGQPMGPAPIPYY